MPLHLKKHEDKRLRQGHVWIYSNEIDTSKVSLKDFTPGDAVTVLDAQGKVLGSAYVNPHSLITGRMISSHADVDLTLALLTERLTAALQWRDTWYDQPFYRWVFGESDALPGLVIDRHGDVIVVQLNTAGMERHKALICEAIKALVPVKSILIRADSSMRSLEQLPSYVEVYAGEETASTLIEENGVHFEIPLLQGQKTGWFYDQRDNRALLKRFVAGKSVLDVFSYVGSFGVQAAVFGAAKVHCVDASDLAIQQVHKNAKLNQVDAKVTAEASEAFTYLRRAKEQSQRFDVVIIDPPAFIKKRKDIKQGVQAYHRLNEAALQLLAPGGLLVSASCSLHMPEAELIHAVQCALAKQGRHGRLVHRGQQGFDHPIHGAIPETAYLKALYFQCD